MKKEIKIKITIMGILAFIVIGGIFAWWHRELAQNNRITADTVSSEIIGDFSKKKPSGRVKKNIAFKNTGSSDVLLRFAYVESWKRKEKDQVWHLQNSIPGSNLEYAKKEWTEAKSKEWIDGGDGWFYYLKTLNPNETTKPIMDSILFSHSSNEYPYDEADYNIYFKVEMVQVSSGDATLNKKEVNKEASETVFEKKAVVDNKGKVTWS